MRSLEFYPILSSSYAKFVLIIIFLCFGFISQSQSEYAGQKTCITGYKILTRQKLLDKNNQNNNINNQSPQRYSLSYKCLCPNDYHGQECSYHKDISCYAQPLQLQQNGKITHANIKQEMQFQLNVSLRCWIRQFSSDIFIQDTTTVQLSQYLTNHNSGNNFGVQEQFGENIQIVWANTTSIFDANGELLINDNLNQSTTDNDQETVKALLIGDNLELSLKPFVYSSVFLGFGMIDGSVEYDISIIKPSKGYIKTTKVLSDQVNINGLSQYISQYQNAKNQMENARKQLQILSKQTQNMDLNFKDPQQFIAEIIKRISKINQTDKTTTLQNITKVYPNNYNSIIPIKSQPKHLPTTKIPIKINPYQSAQYQAIRIQLTIINTFQANLKHIVTLSSPNWVIQVQSGNLGVPTMANIDLTVTENGMKSYWQIVILILVILVLFILGRYLYRWYTKLKKLQYTQTQAVQLISSQTTYMSSFYRSVSSKNQDNSNININNKQASLKQQSSDSGSAMSKLHKLSQMQIQISSQFSKDSKNAHQSNKNSRNNNNNTNSEKYQKMVQQIDVDEDENENEDNEDHR